MIEKQKNCESSAKNTPVRNTSSVAGLPGPASLTDDALEKLYRSYSLKQKRSGLSCFIVTSVVFDLWAIVVPQGQSIESLGKLNFYTCGLNFMEKGYECHTKPLNFY